MVAVVSTVLFGVVGCACLIVHQVINEVPFNVLNYLLIVGAVLGFTLYGAMMAH